MNTKRILIALVILTSFAFVSCKKEKDYVCECSANGNASGTSFVIHDTQENAKKKCEATPAVNGCGLQ